MTKRFPLLNAAFASGAIAIIFAACGPSTNTAIPNGIGTQSFHEPAQAAFREPADANYRTIYEFNGAHRGATQPAGQLFALNGVLYGTTYFGGTRGVGTVFSLTPSGEEQTIYAFNGGRDGDTPNAGLIAVNGMLYGTTRGGGGGCRQHSGCGTVFALTTSGQKQIIYRFKGGSDGYSPTGSLTWLDGRFYGVTSFGGINTQCPQWDYGTGCGIVFSVDVSGNETVLHRFVGNNDGAAPNGPLLALHGRFYGTTRSGGAAGNCNYYCGTIFSVTTSGAETVLHDFASGSDGSSPAGPLIYLHGMLYGTTTGGGSKCCGTVFKSTTSGDETPIFSFGKRPDAQSPSGTLTVDHGVLYGTAQGGKSCFYYQSGTIFAINTAGAERVIHTYPCKPEYEPMPSLLLFDRTLYGATYFGGKGAGTIFALTP